MGERATEKVREMARERMGNAQKPELSFEQFIADDAEEESPDKLSYKWQHRLNSLEQRSQVAVDNSAASAVPLGKFIKKFFLKIMSPVLLPIMREQNAYNLEIAEIIRDMQQEIILLEKRNKELQDILLKKNSAEPQAGWR